MDEKRYDMHIYIYLNEHKLLVCTYEIQLELQWLCLEIEKNMSERCYLVNIKYDVNVFTYVSQSGHQWESQKMGQVLRLLE